MNIKIKRILHSLGIGAGALVVGTVIYAAIENRIAHINDQTALNNYFQDNKLALVEFYDPECPVCNAFKKAKIFPHAADALPHIGFAMVSKVEGSDLHHKNRIEYFPTFIYFKDGKEFKRTVGYSDEASFIHGISAAFAQDKG